MRRIKSRKSFLVIILTLIISLSATGAYYWLQHGPNKTPPAIDNVGNSVVPDSITRSVNFPVYYPDPAKLPSGYTLNRSSFSNPVKNGVYYSASYGNGKKIAFSVQAKPSDSELASFKSSYIPLRIEYGTSVGQAEIGAYQNKTLVSLPILNGPWIVITAPPDINQEDLKSILSAMKH